jgi:hypothetical protein
MMHPGWVLIGYGKSANKGTQAMDAGLDSTASLPTKGPAVRRSRLDLARCLGLRDQLDSPTTCKSQIARCLGVPDSTLRTWLKHRQEVRQASAWPPAVVEFFESAPGQCCLHRLLTAAHLVFVQANDAGIRSLGTANVQNRVFFRELLPTQSVSLSAFVPTELARWND